MVQKMLCLQIPMKSRGTSFSWSTWIKLSKAKCSYHFMWRWCWSSEWHYNAQPICAYDDWPCVMLSNCWQMWSQGAKVGARVTSSSELGQFSNIFKPRILKVLPCRVFSLQYIMCHLPDNYSTMHGVFCTKKLGLA
jgi:hypothetical protein